MRKILVYLLMSNEKPPEAEQNFMSRGLVQVPGLADCIAAAIRLKG